MELNSERCKDSPTDINQNHPHQNSEMNKCEALTTDINHNDQCLVGRLEKQRESEQISCRTNRENEYRERISEENTGHTVTRTHLILGIILVIISNISYLGSNWLLKIFDIRATEVGSVRGFSQIIMFSLLYLREHRKTEEKTKMSCTSIVHLLAYGLLMSSCSFACLASISLMPIGDLIVLAFTSPAFTVFLAFLILKQELTLLKIFLSFTIIGGDILVVQPPFIFGHQTSQEFVPTNFTDDDFISIEEVPGHNTNYFIGAGLCIGAALAASTAQIYSTKLSSIGVSNNILMLTAGTFNFLYSFAFIPIIPNRLLNGDGLSTNGYYILPVAAALTIGAFWCVTLALDYLRDPTLVGMLRSTEILFSLITESIYDNCLPNPISLTGSMVVLICVCCMALHDGLQRSVLDTINRIKKEMQAERNTESDDEEYV